MTTEHTATAGRSVIARVSRHALRLEREFQIAKSVIKETDPTSEHFVRPVEFVKLPAKHGSEAIVCSIFESPGPNYLRELVNLGPNYYRGISKRGSWDKQAYANLGAGQIPLLTFLDFAIGAAECLQILHYGNRLVHGELRGDAFHFNQDTGVVKMINFGNGARAFEHGLTSAGWSSLSQEIGIEHKLQFIAPEQTGRLPAEPDSRTDIYSLGILFWIILTGEPAFERTTSLDIMQSVLSRRIPPVSTKRIDLPDVLSSVIQRMTQRNIDDRYHSTSGLKYDLVKIREMLCEGDGEGLKSFQIASKDVPAFFNLPSNQIGRKEERKILIDIIEAASKRVRRTAHVNSSLMSLSSHSSVSDFRDGTVEDRFSDSASSKGSEVKTHSSSGPTFLDSSNPQRSQESVTDSLASTEGITPVELRPQRSDETASRSNSITEANHKTSLRTRHRKRKGNTDIV